MKAIGEFTNLYPVSKTLRFELIPIGSTMKHLNESGLLDSDKEKAEKYIVMKSIIDDYHRKFIDDVLSDCKLDWAPLYNAIMESKGKKEDKASAVRLEKEQEKFQKEIISLFRSRKEYDYLFNEKLFSILLKEEIEKRGIEEEVQALLAFDKFSGYFLGFHENRKNMYSDEQKSTSIAYRIVCQNFPKYVTNCNKYELIRVEMPEVIVESKKELSQHLVVNYEKLFSIEGFNSTLTQSGIDHYNTILGGISEEDSKIRGINEFLNLYHQNRPDSKKIRLEPLFKQILAKSESHSFIPRAFSDEKEVMQSISDYYDSIRFDTIQRVPVLFKRMREYDVSKIFVDQKYITKISTILFGQWSTLGGLMELYKSDELGDIKMEKIRKKVDKWLESKEFSMKEILDSVSDDETDIIKKYSESIDESLLSIDRCDKSCLSNGSSVLGNDLWKQSVKALLDTFMDFYHLMKPFDAREELDLDISFYSEFNELFECIKEIVPLYNKVRNFVTKKQLSSFKLKMNFGNPTLANGWDLNKERDNTAVLFLRGGKYYLGIMNPSKKTDFSKINGDSEDGYKKMVYKLLPGPNKMLPKVLLVSEKAKLNYKPDADLLKAYEEGKHKKGEKFDIDFCHKLIDYFKETIVKYDDWSIFDFKFSPTESYEDISQFYAEVANQGYKVTFSNIPSEKIDELVENGSLYLFQLYTKDYSDHSFGKKNLHTIYWNAAFSEENLSKVRIRLNGEAEVFYRPRSDIDVITHRKGTVLVRKTDKDGNPIPDKIYYELFRYKTGQIKELSPEASKYFDCLVTKEAKYDITKDRRYTVDKMFFHVPLTFNSGADGKTNINRKAVDFAKESEEIHYIGIDRGERNLIYVSVIDKDGRIVEQKDYNIIGRNDYHKKLDVREKERKDALRSWDSVEKIKDLKEGYISQVIHEISQKIIDYNAVVFMEDLNFGFKRGRFKFEKQVYQKFEKMLIDKLNYLVFKDSEPTEPGGVLNAYQLTDKFVSFQKMGKQSGILFYVPAAYTSAIDPTTGFVDLFNKASIKTAADRKQFIGLMDSIKYSAADNGFDFSFDYHNFNISKADWKNRWMVSTRGKRIVHSRKENDYMELDPTAELSSILSKNGIAFTDGSDIRDAILSSDQKVVDSAYYAFIQSLRMRNSNKEVDYIQSPVKNRDGYYFVSGERPDYPKDADANGAYNIALKGKMLLDMVNLESEKGVKLPLMSHTEWFEFVQKRCM